MANIDAVTTSTKDHNRGDPESFLFTLSVRSWMRFQFSYLENMMGRRKLDGDFTVKIVEFSRTD